MSEVEQMSKDCAWRARKKGRVTEALERPVECVTKSDGRRGK